MPSAPRCSGISATSAGGPQTKHSVAGSWTSSLSAARSRRPRAPLQSASFARVTVWRSAIVPRPRHLAQLRLEGEVVRRPRAVEQTDVAMRNRQGMVQHRAQRRDPRAAGDEHEAALLGLGRKCEGAERALDIHARVRAQRQMRTRAAVRVDADEQLEPAVAPRVFGRGGERVRRAASSIRACRSSRPVLPRSRRDVRRDPVAAAVRAASPAALRESSA